MKLIKLKLLVIAAIMFAASAASASLSTYAVSIDTSSLIGTSGALDFQFNPANSTGFTTATAGISGFTGGTLSSPVLTGDGSGTLPSSVTLNNTTQYNDYFTNYTFGNSIKFNLSLSGALGNSFTFSMFSDAAGSSPALTSDTTDGYALRLDINQNGNAITNNIPTNISSSVTPTPIPPSMLLFASGLSGMFFMKRKKTAA